MADDKTKVFKEFLAKKGDAVSLADVKIVCKALSAGLDPGKDKAEIIKRCFAILGTNEFKQLKPRNMDAASFLIILATFYTGLGDDIDVASAIKEGAKELSDLFTEHLSTEAKVTAVFSSVFDGTASDLVFYKALFTKNISKNVAEATVEAAGQFKKEFVEAAAAAEKQAKDVEAKQEEVKKAGDANVGAALKAMDQQTAQLRAEEVAIVKRYATAQNDLESRFSKALAALAPVFALCYNGINKETDMKAFCAQMLSVVPQSTRAATQFCQSTPDSLIYHTLMKDAAAIVNKVKAFVKRQVDWLMKQVKMYWQDHKSLVIAAGVILSAATIALVYYIASKRVQKVAKLEISDKANLETCLAEANLGTFKMPTWGAIKKKENREAVALFVVGLAALVFCAVKIVNAVRAQKGTAIIAWSLGAVASLAFPFLGLMGLKKLTSMKVPQTSSPK